MRRDQKKHNLHSNKTIKDCPSCTHKSLLQILPFIEKEESIDCNEIKSLEKKRKTKRVLQLQQINEESIAQKEDDEADKKKQYYAKVSELEMNHHVAIVNSLVSKDIDIEFQKYKRHKPQMITINPSKAYLQSHIHDKDTYRNHQYKENYSYLIGDARDVLATETVL